MNDPTDVVGRRVGAWFIDLLIYLVVVLVAAGGVTKHTDAGTTTYSIGGGSWVVFVSHFVAYCLIQGLAGGSLGKLAVGLRVVTADGANAGVGRSFLRTFLWIADAITFGFPVVGGVLILSTKGHRRVGDIGASTFVVDQHAVGQPVRIPGLTVAPGYVSGQPVGFAPTYQPGPVPPDQVPSGGPTWDATRGAYVQLDPASGTWLQFDEATRQWKPAT